MNLCYLQNKHSRLKDEQIHVHSVPHFHSPTSSDVQVIHTNTSAQQSRGRRSSAAIFTSIYLYLLTPQWRGSVNCHSGPIITVLNSLCSGVWRQDSLCTVQQHTHTVTTQPLKKLHFIDQNLLNHFQTGQHWACANDRTVNTDRTQMLMLTLNDTETHLTQVVHDKMCKKVGMQRLRESRVRRPARWLTGAKRTSAFKKHRDMNYTSDLNRCKLKSCSAVWKPEDCDMKPQRCWNIWSNMSCKTLNLPCRDTQHSCNHSSIYTLVIYNSNIEMKIKIIIQAAVPPLRRLSDSPSQKTESVCTEQQTKASGLLSSSSGE